MKEEPKEDISLKEIIKKTVEWKNYFVAKWKFIVIIGILGGALGFTYAYVKKPVYHAALTFALEEKNSSGGLGAYAGIASQFGFDIGGGSGGAFSGDNILELMRSRLLIESSLLSEVEINGKKDLLVNRYIQFNKLNEKWEKSSNLKSLSYQSPVNREQFSISQDSVLFIITSKIKTDNLEVAKVDKKLNIVKVKFNSEDELFAKFFIEALVKNVSEFYISTKTQKSRSNVEMLQSRTDSVKRELDREMYGVAISQDQNQNLVRAQAKVPGVKRQMNVQLLSTMYGELVKNLELSKMALSREEPLVQIIDRPILPLEKDKAGKAKSIIVGGLIAGFLALIYLFLKKIISNLI